MALCGSEIWDRAIRAGINLAMEASVAGGIPIHAVLREGISGDRINALYGILNGTSNYILTEIEKRGADFAQVLAEAQPLGYAEADPSADMDGFDARSKLAILAALAFGEKIVPADIYVEAFGVFRLWISIRAHVGSHYPVGVYSAADACRTVAVGPAVADSAIDDSGERSRRLQRRVGARKIRRRYFLLRARRGRASDGRCRRQRLDAGGARDRSGSPERVSPFAQRGWENKIRSRLR